jgi:hypothetical protein
MSLGAQFGVQETEVIQFSFLDFLRVGFHLLDVPVDTHIPSIEEIGLGGAQPKGETTAEYLLVFRKWCKGLDDRATIVSRNDARVNREDAKVGVLWQK